MKLETVKTFTLFILIGISLLLTFGMWNYQPNFEPLNNELTNDTSLYGSEEYIWSLVEPTQIVFHVANNHYGFNQPKERNDFFQKVREWELTNLVSENMTDSNTVDYDVEVVFPTPLPMQVMDSLFKLNAANIELPSWSFQRVYYTLNEVDESVKVEFVSIDGRNKSVAWVRNQSSYKSLQDYISTDELQELALFDEGGTEIFIPKGNVSLSRQTKTVSPIEPNDLVDVLFTDPSIVRQSSSFNRGTTYFTDSSQMRVTQGGATMEFVSPAADIDEPLFAEDLLNKSIAHLNSYSGWTDEYKLMGIDVYANNISYQMYYLNYPVYGQLSTIEQKWGQRLISYQRPLFRIDKDNFLNDSTVELPSGQAIISYLVNESSFELNNISDIQIGYQLNYKSNDRYTIFNPSWFINYRGAWIPISAYNEENNLEGGD